MLTHDRSQYNGTAQIDFPVLRQLSPLGGLTGIASWLAFVILRLIKPSYIAYVVNCVCKTDWYTLDLDSRQPETDGVCWTQRQCHSGNIHQFFSTCLLALKRSSCLHVFTLCDLLTLHLSAGGYSAFKCLNLP